MSTKIAVSYESYEYRATNLFGVLVWTPWAITIDWKDQPMSQERKDEIAHDSEQDMQDEL